MDTTESQKNSAPQQRAETSKEPSPQKDQDNSPSGMWSYFFFVLQVRARVCECLYECATLKIEAGVRAFD